MSENIFRKWSGLMREELKVQYSAGKQQKAVYNTVSSHGDTLSISEVGRAANSVKDNKLGNEDITDGIVRLLVVK